MVSLLFPVCRFVFVYMLTTEFYLYAAWYILNIETLYLTIIARNYLSLSY